MCRGRRGCPDTRALLLMGVCCRRKQHRRREAGLTRPFTLPHDLPPLRLLLVWDNLTGHKTPELVLWLCAHGVMPLYTPVGGSWLNMAESIERVLKRRALDGQHPHRPDEIGCWFEQTARAWNAQPTPFVWNGKRRRRRERARLRRLAGSGAAVINGYSIAA